MKSIPYLVKALSSGISGSAYYLSYAYINFKDNEMALKFLKKYQKSYPDDPRIKDIYSSS